MQRKTKKPNELNLTYVSLEEANCSIELIEELPKGSKLIKEYPRLIVTPESRFTNGGNRSTYEGVRASNVYSLKCNRFLKPQITLDGYYRIFIKTAAECFWFRIHRLVAAAFVPNQDPSKLTEVDHCNNYKRSNEPWNWRWVSSEQNKNNNQTKEILEDGRLMDKIWDELRKGTPIVEVELKFPFVAASRIASRRAIQDLFPLI